MKTMDCRGVRREIDSIEPDQGLTNEASRHLAQCPSCRQASERGASLRTLVAGLGAVDAPPDFDMRLRARLAREKQAGGSWVNFWRQATGVPAFALALSLLVLGAGVIFLVPSSDQKVAVTSDTATPKTAPATEPPIQAKPIANTSTTDNQTVAVVAPGKQTTPSPRPRRAGNEPASQKAGLSSREFSSLPAVSVNNSSTSASPVVSLSAPLQPVVVSMRDDRGGTRTISLPPVSFGSQKLIQSAYQPVSLASSARGAW